MRLLSFVAAMGLVVLISSAANARGGGPGVGGGFGGSPGYGASSYSPGQQFRSGGAITGYPGASGYAPGHRFKRHTAHGASTYAPGYRMRH